MKWVMLKINLFSNPGILFIEESIIGIVDQMMVSP